MSDSESDFDVDKVAEKALASLLPGKSKEKYEKTYDNFKKWCKEKKIDIINENVLLGYFSSELSELKSSTTWSIYSMLKSTLSVKENVNISGYHKLIALLKRKRDGYFAKKSKILTKEEIFRFIKEAPDVKFLAMKVTDDIFKNFLILNDYL